MFSGWSDERVNDNNSLLTERNIEKACCSVSVAGKMSILKSFGDFISPLSHVAREKWDRLELSWKRAASMEYPWRWQLRFSKALADQHHQQWGCLGETWTERMSPQCLLWASCFLWTLIPLTYGGRISALGLCLVGSSSHPHSHGNKDTSS